MAYKYNRLGNSQTDYKLETEQKEEQTQDLNSLSSQPILPVNLKKRLEGGSKEAPAKNVDPISRLRKIANKSKIIRIKK